jgi:hypothetical protein
MCQLCDVAGAGAGGLPHFAAAGSAQTTGGGATRAPGAAETPLPEGVGAKGRRGAKR